MVENNNFKQVIKQNGKQLVTIEDNLTPTSETKELICPECKGLGYVQDIENNKKGAVHTCFDCMGSGKYKK